MTRVSERDRAHPLLHAISRVRCAVTDLRSRSVDGIVRDFVIFIFAGRRRRRRREDQETD